MTAAAISLTEEHLTVSYDSANPEEHADLGQCVRDLHELRQVQAALKAWENVLSEFIADGLGRNAIDVDGVGQVVVKHGTDRKAWDTRQLLRAVLDSRLPPSPDGELDPSDDGHAEVKGEAISCSPDLSRVLQVWNLGAPRVTALKDRGIDPGEFCESTPGRVSVVIE